MNNSASYINDVNTTAVQLLQQGRHVKAICCLRRGVKFVLAQVDEDTNSTDRPSLVPGHGSSLERLDSMDIEGDERLTYTVAIPEVHHNIMSVSPENVFSVFNRAFMNFGVVSSSADCTKAAATLLYNMGLAFHHLGIQENDTAALKKSLYTYQMAYRILGQKCDDSFSYLVMVALCNNMSHIHGHFFDLKEARSNWDLITEVLAGDSLVDSSVAVDDYAFFVSEEALFAGRKLELKCAPAA
jgi:hypothetical protein